MNQNLSFADLTQAAIQGVRVVENRIYFSTKCLVCPYCCMGSVRNLREQIDNARRAGFSLVVEVYDCSAPHEILPVIKDAGGEEIWPTAKENDAGKCGAVPDIAGVEWVRVKEWRPER